MPRLNLSDISVFVYDLDGTLVGGIPYEKVLKEVERLTGHPFDELMKRYKSERKGLDKAETYHMSLAKNNPDKMKIIESYRQFREAKKKPTILPGAIETLIRTGSLGLGRECICWTHGEDTLQRQTLSASGLDKYFEQVVVTDAKNVDTVREQLLPLVRGRSFAVFGDSYDQDMVPVKGHAALRFWLAGSEANAYIDRPAAVDKDIIEVQSMQDVLRLLNESR